MGTLTARCEWCGQDFEAQSPRARFCSSSCRGKANRRRPGLAEDVPGGSGEDRADPEAAARPERPPAPVYDTLAEQVAATLSELKALDTISGRAAVRVAQQIDRGGDTGSAVATLSKELSRLVEEAKVESAPLRRDDVDDIADRASEKILRLVR